MKLRVFPGNWQSLRSSLRFVLCIAKFSCYVIFCHGLCFQSVAPHQIKSNFSSFKVFSIFLAFNICCINQMYCFHMKFCLLFVHYPCLIPMLESVRWLLSISHSSDNKCQFQNQAAYPKYQCPHHFHLIYPLIVIYLGSLSSFMFTFLSNLK